MKPLRLHLLGASGSGTTTLGRALATRLGCTFVDADDVYWAQTNPPFQKKNSIEERRRLLEEALPRTDAWVVSGSMTTWGNFLRTVFTHVIFLSLEEKERMRRLHAREVERYGARIQPGGDMEKIHQEFLAWALRYETGGMDVRSRVWHEQWMRSLPCPVLRLDSRESTNAQLESVLASIRKKIGPVTVKALPGEKAAPFVNPFFTSLRRTTMAAPSDLFFVAFKENGETAGCVRYCVEEGVHMLRGMLIAETARRQGVGQLLLDAFDRHLKREKIGPVYCLPHLHLGTFYAGIGFRKIPESEAPAFLLERMEKYRKDGMTDVTIMRRPEA